MYKNQFGENWMGKKKKEEEGRWQEEQVKEGKIKQVQTEKGKKLISG